jgi:putative colanic acid biosynthesis glycosyltransferase
MMTSPLISIVTVTLNNIDGLKKTSHSLSSQNAKDYEWIVIDGASTDGTDGFLSHSTATYISEPDNGLYDAMNKGIGRATGTYILFMNAGDVFASTSTLETITQHIKDNNSDFIYGDALEISNDKEIYKHARPHSTLLKGMMTHHQSMIYKRECLDNLQYDLRYKIAADYNFTLRFLKTAKKITYIPFPLCVFESGGISQTNALKGRIEQFKIRHHFKISLLDKIKTFIVQTLIYSIRKISPRFYWWLKEFSIRAE